MRVLVCGGRTFGDYALLQSVLSDLGVSELIHGGAPGADSLASEWARAVGVAEIVFKAEWNKHGRAAGPIRNQRMLTEGKPHRVVAFPGGRGTADMVRRAKGAGVEVLDYGSTIDAEVGKCSS